MAGVAIDVQMTRWEALVKFDDEIREAASKLIPFGAEWVDQLGEAFIALNEDRKYLPNIVARLTEEAKRTVFLNWLAPFSETADGERTSEEALAVLVDAQGKGFDLSKNGDGAIVIKRNTSTSFLRSNADILRFRKMLDRSTTHD